jgi:hypothetical protein
MSDHLLPDSTTPQQTTPETAEIEALLRTYRPDPGQHLYEQVAKAAWMQPQPGSRRRMANFRPKITSRWALAFFSILLVFALILLTPQGRSLAQSITQFFMFANSDHRTEVLSMTPIPTPDPGYPYNLYTLNIAQAEALAGFKLKLVTGLPDKWVFRGAMYDPKNQQVDLFYSLPAIDSTADEPKEAVYMYVSELKGEFEKDADWGECPDGTITKLKINGWPAELSNGTIWETFTPPTPGVTREWKCVKTDPESVMDLRWQETDLKYELSVDQLTDNTSLWLTQSDLIKLAETMK